MENSAEIEDIKSPQDAISSAKSKEEALKVLFDRIFDGNQTICVKGRRKTGKSTLIMEIIVQNLISNPEKEILLLNTYGNFNIRKFAEICQAYCEIDDKKAVSDLMKRLKIIQIETEKDFYEYLSCLEALILGFSQLQLIVIDTISFFYHISYIFQKVYGKVLRKEMYLTHYLNTFAELTKQYNLTILFTIPQHLVKDYSESIENTSENEEEERKIYEHMKSKSITTADHKYPILDWMEMSQPVQVTLEGKKNGTSESEPLCTATSETTDNTENPPSVQAITEATNSLDIKSSILQAENPSSDPNSDKISTKSSNLGEVQATISYIDSLSDGNSIKSGEGYKSESGTDESDVENEKIAEKKILAMERLILPDVTINLFKISSSGFMMQIKKDLEDFDVNFDIAEDGVNWDDVPAEKLQVYN